MIRGGLAYKGFADKEPRDRVVATAHTCRDALVCEAKRCMVQVEHVKQRWWLNP